MRSRGITGAGLWFTYCSLMLMVLLGQENAQAAPWITAETSLAASDQARFLQFGRSVAISADGKTAIVGSDKNAAYIYTRTQVGWTQVQKLIKPKALRCNSNGAYFGSAVAISGNGSTIMVGASGIVTVDSIGIPIDTFLSCRDLPVYVKRGGKWALQKILSFPDITENDMFGSSIAVSKNGRRAIVGAELSRCTGFADTCGAVYFIERGANGWNLQKRIVSDQAFNAQSGFFGSTTAISADGRWALTGAPGGRTSWIFRRKPGPAGWEMTETLKFPDSRLAVEFGSAVALSAQGTRAVITAQSAGDNDDCRGDYSHCGAAYSFVRTGNVWSFEGSFTAADSHDFNSFGGSIALSGNGKRVVVGTTEADCVNGNCGAAYLFDWDGTQWVQRDRVTGPSAGLGGYLLGAKFGGAVAMDQSGSHLFVSAREENCADGLGCGLVYKYSLGR